MRNLTDDKTLGEYRHEYKNVLFSVATYTVDRSNIHLRNNFLLCMLLVYMTMETECLEFLPSDSIHANIELALVLESQPAGQQCQVIKIE